MGNFRNGLTQRQSAGALLRACYSLIDEVTVKWRSPLPVRTLLRFAVIAALIAQTTVTIERLSIWIPRRDVRQGSDFRNNLYSL
eukprot:scaffold518346_cov18-Prasinocladus_malaysianus.AAC.1